MSDETQFLSLENSSSNDSTTDCVITFVLVLHTQSHNDMSTTNMDELQSASMVPSISPHTSSAMNSLEHDSPVSYSTPTT